MIYKHDLWNLPTIITSFFYLIYLFNVLLCNRILSYFAKPNFIIYDEWFDDDLEKTKLDLQNKKIKSIANLHEFFYENSNYKIGASENNFQLDIKVNKKELITNNFLQNTSEKHTLLSNKIIWFLDKLTKSKLKFNITKKLIYSLSIFGFLLIFVFLLFFISQSRKNESNITNKSLIIEKIF